MKNIFLVIVLVSSSYLVFDIIDDVTQSYRIEKEKQHYKENPVFHLKIKYDPVWSNYRILFTNDNWITEEEINNTFNLAGADKYVFDVAYQVDLFDSEQEAISLAKELKTYDLCIAYNKRIKKRYDKLFKIFKAQPKREENKPEPRKDITIY